MSDSYREQGLKAKAARIGVIEQRAMPGKNKRQKSVVVESRPNRAFFGRSRGWRKWGSYRNEGEAEAAMAQLARKYTFFEYRIKP